MRRAARDRPERSPTRVGTVENDQPQSASESQFTGETVLYWHTHNGVGLTERVEASSVEATLPETYRQFFPSASV